MVDNIETKDSIGKTKEIMIVVERFLNSKSISFSKVLSNWKGGDSVLIISVYLNEKNPFEKEEILGSLSNYFFNLSLKDELANISCGFSKENEKIFIYNLGFRKKY